MKLNHNIGGPDRIFRVLTAVIIASLFFSNIITGIVAFVLLSVAAILIATSFISFCPLYYLFQISSKKKNV